MEPSEAIWCTDRAKLWVRGANICQHGSPDPVTEVKHTEPEYSKGLGTVQSWTPKPQESYSSVSYRASELHWKLQQNTMNDFERFTVALLNQTTVTFAKCFWNKIACEAQSPTEKDHGVHKCTGPKQEISWHEDIRMWKSGRGVSTIIAHIHYLEGSTFLRGGGQLFRLFYTRTKLHP